MRTIFKGREVFLKESTSDLAIVCRIHKIQMEGGTAFYEVEANGDIFHIAVESVQWVKERKDLKLIDIDRVNFAPLRIINPGH